MNRFLKIASIGLGFALLYISIGWSKDGFGFDFGVGMDKQKIEMYGYILALSATVLQFMFSTVYKELNPTLLLLGLIAYVYSIGTNIAGITVMQGNESPTLMSWILAIIMDVAPEPMIAWGLGDALAGDLLGNAGMMFKENEKKNTKTVNKSDYTPKHRPDLNKRPSPESVNKVDKNTRLPYKQPTKKTYTHPWRS